ncbi:MAG: hypothetical protein IRZ21_06370 [Thermoleophilaceae bacterium]|nr:hypothetical protein [Thermoleophilaceae bacterium]
MTDIDRLLSEFVDAWNAGERPRVEEYLARAPEDRRDELADLIEAFLDVAPTPDYSPETLEELMRHPAVLASVEALEGRSGLWPSLLPRLRRRARLRRDQVVSALVERLGIEGSEEKTARYLHELETGTLAAAGVSRRVIEALAGVLGASAAELERGADFRGLGTGGAEPVYLRAEPGAEPREVRLDRPGPPPESEWDEVDRLFLGGREEAGR